MRRLLLVVTLLVAALAHGDDVNRGWHWRPESDMSRDMNRMDLEVLRLTNDERMRLRAKTPEQLPEVLAKHRALLSECNAVEQRALGFRDGHPDWLAPEYLWLLARNNVDRAANLVLIDKLTPYAGRPIGGEGPRGTIEEYLAQAEARLKRRCDLAHPYDRDELNDLGKAEGDFLIQALW